MLLQKNTFLISFRLTGHADITTIYNLSTMDKKIEPLAGLDGKKSGIVAET